MTASRGEGKPKRCACPVRCKFCGARLRHDGNGPYCNTTNCQWSVNGGNPPFCVAKGKPKAKRVTVVFTVDEWGLLRTMLACVPSSLWSAEADVIYEKLRRAKPRAEKRDGKR